MIIISKFTILLSIVVYLSGCATGAAFSDMNPGLSATNPEEGRIFFYRTATMGAAVTPDIHLNDEVIAESKARGFTFVDKPAGEYIVKTSTEVERNLSFVLEPGETRYIKQNISMGFMVGHVYSVLVPESEALDEIAACKYMEPTVR